MRSKAIFNEKETFTPNHFVPQYKLSKNILVTIPDEEESICNLAEAKDLNYQLRWVSLILHLIFSIIERILIESSSMSKGKVLQFNQIVYMIKE